MTTLKRGSRGAAVRDLQTRLNLILKSRPLVVDGDFGGQTETAVRSFQSGFDLVVDGIAGRQTLAALKQATTPAKPGKAEPNKSVMAVPAPAGTVTSDRAAPPPNTVTILDTARSIRELIWHCAATSEGKDFTVADIRAWHKQRGWSDIGYHFIVYRDGRIMLGRPIGQVGSHVSGHNTGTIGACYIGGVSKDGKTAKDTRTPAQRASMLWLTQQLAGKFQLQKVGGHNQYAAKACPSFDVRADALGRVI
jgi:N-acetylmuramoyl-L-alanine amidase